MRWIAGEKPNERRLVDTQASDMIRPAHGKTENHDAAEGVAHKECRTKVEVVDERSEVSDVLIEGSLPGGRLALTMTTAVVGQDAE